jgi:uncharacterized membrane-anchored protein
MLRTFTVAITLVGGLASSIQAQTLHESVVAEAVAKLDWEFGANSHILSSSNATLYTQQDEAFLQNRDAKEFVRVTEGHTRFQPDALVMKIDGPMTNSYVMYTYMDMGYVKTDDWNEYINANDILSEIKKNTAETNKVRAEGYPAVYVDDWIEQPHLDRQNAIVYWAIKGHSEAGSAFVNAKALKLGRKGITDIVWVGAPEQFQDASRSLQPALEAYRYGSGDRYADFQPGVDTVAAVGVGAIAYKMLTGSNKKGAAAVGAGILAIVAALAKKLWLLIVLPFVFAWKAIKRIFTGNSKA